MPGRRIWLRLTAWLFLLVLILFAVAWLGVNRLLDQQQISQIEWQGLRLSSDGLQLQQLDFTHPTARVELKGLRAEWLDFKRPAPWLRQISLEHANVSITDSESTDDAAPTAVDVPSTANLIALIPARLDVKQLELQVPCAQQRCTLSGALQAKNTSRYAPDLNLDLSVRLALQHDGNELDWQARLLGIRYAPHLQVDLAINQRPQLLLLTSLEPKANGQFWHTLVNADIQQAAALHSWLQQWLPDSARQLSQAPQSARIEAQASLLLPSGPLRAESLAQATGALTAYANLPQPWPIPGIGQIQGQLDATAKSVDGQWLAESLSSNLTLSEISAELSQLLPAGLNPDAVQIKIQPTTLPSEVAEGLAGRSLPVKAQLMMQGKAPLVADGTLILSNNLPWAVQLVDTQVNANNLSLSLAELSLKKLKAQLKLNGYIAPQQFHVQLNNGSTLSAKQLSYSQWQADDVEARSQNLHLEGKIVDNSAQAWTLQGDLDIAAKPIHEQLNAQRWYWQGPVKVDTDSISLNGNLRNDAQLSTQLTIQNSSTKGLDINAQLAEIFLRSGNPLQGSFSAWPALLELNNGRLKASAKLTLKPSQNFPEISLNLTGKGLAGIYDRTELTGLSGNPKVKITSNSLQLDLPDLTLEQANPGIALGPLQLQGSYQAPLQSASAGTLQLTKAESALVGGKLHLPSGQWKLDNSTLTFPFELEGLELEQLFILYPTEGLAGHGTIDGHLPLQLNADGFSINDGHVQAREPGGKLQFNSERIRQLGRSNPAMQLVTQSLEDFQFSTLSSQVNYDPQGKLNLGIRLEGQNQAIEKGRPIHFNINLQEDIPTLLASLQLSDKVSEVIKQRVQKRMLEREASEQR
ncbi:YdbH domain-containing protein [Ectopseudomonas mendocina]|uniref:YdbH domain-containing protein n=1 Tax=Ectopseudomonas mendocina TaxID=300 RepID=A0ABZ2RRZ0_ECTME